MFVSAPTAVGSGRRARPSALGIGPKQSGRNTQDCPHLASGHTGLQRLLFLRKRDPVLPSKRNSSLHQAQQQAQGGEDAVDPASAAVGPTVRTWLRVSVGHSSYFFPAGPPQGAGPSALGIRPKKCALDAAKIKSHAQYAWDLRLPCKRIRLRPNATATVSRLEWPLSRRPLGKIASTCLIPSPSLPPRSAVIR